MNKLGITLLGVLMLAPAGAQALQMSTTTADGRVVTVTSLTPYIIRVSNHPKDVLPAPSRGVILTEQRQDLRGSVTDNSRSMTMTTGDDNLHGNLTVILDKATGAVTITDGKRSITDTGVRNISNGRCRMELYPSGKPSYYGAGERGHSLNLAGDTLVMYNRQNYGYTAGDPRIKQMNITMPLVISSDKYGLIFDDYAAAELVLGDPITYTTESASPVDWYYFIDSGPSMYNTSGVLSELIGRQELPPFWALGYITSKYGYHDEAETRAAVDSLKSLGYPLDGIVLDLYWYGKEQDMGRLEWDKEQWPTHRQMLQDLKDQGVNLVAISQPYVLRNGRAIDHYNELAPKGYFVADSTGTAPQEVTIWVGEGGMFDVSNPQTRAWLRDRYKQLTDDGITGWWGDLGEPEVHPETGRHHNGLTARQYHNQYGNDWSEIIYDLFTEKYPDTRLMTMMRAGTTGLQRYSVFPWSTDVSRSWGGLQPQVTIMINSGLSGLGYMSHDVGGFALDEERPYDPELYVRWLQLGVFSPILRTHAQGTAEPFHYPEQQDIILPLIKERYRWLPYNYTMAYDNTEHGIPLVKHLGYLDSSTEYDNITDEYIWGSDVLVAPVLEQGATERQITFPKGINWIDYRDPSKIYEGGTTVTYPAPLEVLPLFIREGALIPTADYPMENTLDYDPSRYTINYYPGNEKWSAGHLFEDDRTSRETLCKSGMTLGECKSTNMEFSAKNTEEFYEIECTFAIAYPGAPAVRDMTFKIYDVKEAPTSVKVNDRKIKTWKYDRATHVLTIEVAWAGGTDMTVTAYKPKPKKK